MLVGLFVVLHSVLRACHRNHTTNFFSDFGSHLKTNWPFSRTHHHFFMKEKIALRNSHQSSNSSILLFESFSFGNFTFLFTHSYYITQPKKNLISQSHWSLSWLFSSSLNINFLSHISQNKKYIFFATRFNSHAHIFCSILLPVMLNRIGKKIEKKIRN